MFVDDNLIKFLADPKLEDRDVKDLYQEFKNTIANPLSIHNFTHRKEAKELSLRAEKLCRKMDSLLLAMVDEDCKKYGRLLGLMRDRLLVDWKCASSFLEDEYDDSDWFYFHIFLFDLIGQEYKKLFGPKE
ncbi:MAG: hypothetical protein JW734_04400 [Candidatus Omnitrophica bacterium]|nr:hypothetical protein [Candidatus Omnitrophota bacterium]